MLYPVYYIVAKEGSAKLNKRNSKYLFYKITTNFPKKNAIQISMCFFY